MEEDFKCKYLNHPISFLTEENLDKLQEHCEKTIRYATRNVLKEHQVTLELIIRYREMIKEKQAYKEKINKTLEMAFQYGQTDGEHHKAWVIDQMVKILTGKNYDKWIEHYMYDDKDLQDGDYYE